MFLYQAINETNYIYNAILIITFYIVIQTTLIEIFKNLVTDHAKCENNADTMMIIPLVMVYGKSFLKGTVNNIETST